LQYVHFPIKDLEVAKDERALLKLVNDILDWFQQGKKIYLHCYGGHGRSGILGSILLARIYGLNAETAMEVNKVFHDCRAEVLSVPVSSIPSPQNHQQRQQVVQIVKLLGT